MTAPSLERPTASAITVPVSLGDRSYDILVGRGLASEAGARIRALGPKAAAIVTDDHVGPLYARGARALPRRRRACAAPRSPCRRAKAPKSFAEVRPALRCGPGRPDRARRSASWPWAAASWATSRVSRPLRCAGACASCRCRRPFSPRSIPPSAERPASTPPTARTSSAPSTSRPSSSPIPGFSTRSRSARCGRATPRW